MANDDDDDVVATAALATRCNSRLLVRARYFIM